MVYQGEAFSPGHITAFFVGHDDPDPLRKGSRGAGLCTTLGVQTTIRAKEARSQSIEIFLNDLKDPAPTTRAALRRLLGKDAYEVKVLSRVLLPVSQGFGMSGAGALSAGLALDDALSVGRPRDEIVAAAHVADVESLTGLGDVVPQSLGGMEMRERPGAPPHAVIRRFPVDAELLLCVIGPPFPKAPVLTDTNRMAKIATAGEESLREFREGPTLENLFRLGRRFALDTDLASPQVAECLAALSAYGRGSMAMLGNSIFATGGEIVATILRGYGTVFRCSADNDGARVT